MTSSTPSSGSLTPTRALLSIKPRFAEAIFRGEKRYEFRRATFKRPVTSALVYSSSPVQKVIGEFDVLGVITAPLAALWRKTKQFAGIDRELFYSYFSGCDVGHAIEIGKTRTFTDPFCPVETLGLRPPQSFLYLDCSAQRARARSRSSVRGEVVW